MKYIILCLLSLSIQAGVPYVFSEEVPEVITSEKINANMAAILERKAQLNHRMYINVHPTNANIKQSSVQSWVKIPIDHLSGDIFGSLANQNMILQPGKYDIDVPVCANKNAGWIHLQFYNETLGSEIELFEYITVSHTSVNLIDFTHVKTTLNITEETEIVINIQSQLAGGETVVSRMNIRRR